jgi:PIN domain nuclease of toxin-antitoxin system
MLGSAAVSAVNLGEVVSKLCERGIPDDEIRRELDRLRLTVLPFDEVLGLEAGMLHRTTRGANISFGDRACLVTARRLGLPAVTADRPWTSLGLGIAVEIIR